MRSATRTLLGRAAPVAVLAAMLLPGAGAAADPSAAPSGTAGLSLADVPGIVDPSNLGWPRQVETPSGVVSVEAPPARIHTLSLGLDEVTLGLVPVDRIAAVGSFTQDPLYSNVAELVADLPAVGRDPEEIIAAGPDLVVASAFSKADLLASLTGAGVPVVQMALHNDLVGRIGDLRLLGYVYGADERAAALAAEIEGRAARLAEAVPMANEPAPRVLALARFADSIDAAGATATEDSIITLAGGVNAAGEAFEGHQPIDLEGIIALAPDVIVIAQATEDAEAFRADLLADPALASVPAVADGAVHVLEPRLITTQSYWNLVGAEELARLLWPEALAGLPGGPFSLPAEAP